MKKSPINFFGKYKYYFFTAAIFLFTGIILFYMGRVPICKCGYIKFWHGVTHSSENSQHLTDFYTFSHIIHGMIFYWLLRKFFKKMSPGKALFMATLVEAAWEILENTDMVINRYRAATISLDYYGDSIINSLSDILAMVFGFYMANKLPVKITVFSAIAMELIVGYLIRDNLTLNVVMLVLPLDFIKNWQSGI